MTIFFERLYVKIIQVFDTRSRHKELGLSLTGNGEKGTAWEADHRKWQTKYSKLDIITLKCNSGISSEPGPLIWCHGESLKILGEKPTGDKLATGIVLKNVNVCENQQDSSTVLDENLIMSTSSFKTPISDQNLRLQYQ